MSPYKRHTPPEAEAALDELTLAKAEYLRRTIEIARDMLMAIRACLDAGATWGEVGRRLGMTKQAARAHWGPYLDQLIAEERRAGTTVEPVVPPEPPASVVPPEPPAPVAPSTPVVPPLAVAPPEPVAPPGPVAGPAPVAGPVPPVPVVPPSPGPG
jgi:hypothetical protein